VESFNLYYEYALEKCMEKDVVSRKHISLVTFAIHCISLDSQKLQVRVVLMMHNLLHQEPSRTQLLSKSSTPNSSSRDEIGRLNNMLEWRSIEDVTIRLFAANVIVVLVETLGYHNP